MVIVFIGECRLLLLRMMIFFNHYYRLQTDGIMIGESIQVVSLGEHADDVRRHSLSTSIDDDG